MNIVFKADLSKYVAYRPSVLYWVVQPGADVGGIGMGLVRMVRPWNEWLIVWGYDINEGAPRGGRCLRHQGRPRPDRRRHHPDRDQLGVHLDGQQSLCRAQHAGRVFCMGDAVHRHPPSNGLGSNTSIQDAFNLAWKLAMVLKGKAGPGLARQLRRRALAGSQADRHPRQQVDHRIRTDLPGAGLLDTKDTTRCRRTWTRASRTRPRPKRSAPASATPIAFKKYEFDAHGVEMNQRYKSAAIVDRRHSRARVHEGRGAALSAHHLARRTAAACLALRSRAGKVSTLDLAGQGRFALFTGIGGEGWIEAAKAVGDELGIEIAAYTIGPRKDWHDHLGAMGGCQRGARQRHRSGPPRPACVLARETIADDPAGELRRVLSSILDR